MSDRLPELHHALPADVQLDGELVAWDDSGRPDWHRLGARMLHGGTSIPVSFIAFDVLACEGLPVTGLPYAKRRGLLEELDLERPPVVQVVPTFDDSEALFRVVCEQGLEGVVAKRERDTYRPGARDWVKTKNRATARFAQESARSRRGSSPGPGPSSAGRVRTSPQHPDRERGVPRLDPPGAVVSPT